MFRHCYKSYNSVCCPRSRPTVCDNDARTFVTFISSCLCKSSSLNLVVFAPASSAPSKSSPAPLRFTARRSTFAMRLSTTAPLLKNSRPRAPSSLTTSRRFPTVRRLFFSARRSPQRLGRSACPPSAHFRRHVSLGHQSAPSGRQASQQRQENHHDRPRRPSGSRRHNGAN